MRKLLVRYHWLFTLFMISCTTYRYIDIQILKPAESSVLIKAPVLILSGFDKCPVQRIINLDTSYYSQFFSDLKKELKKQLNNSVFLSNSRIIFTSPQQLSDETRKLTYNEWKDAVFCELGSIHLKDSIFKKESDDGFYYIYQLKYDLSLNFSKLNNPGIKTSLPVSDTNYWKSSVFPYYVKIDHIHYTIDKVEALKEIVGNIAENFTFHISPFWITCERTIFHHFKMNKAYRLFYHDNLPGALNEWKFVYENSTRKIAAMAANNIAVCYEMMDNVSLSINWIEKANHLNHSEYTKYYQNLLLKRKSDSILLNQQFNINGL